MTERTSPTLKALAAATRVYRQTEVRHEEARKAAIEAVLNALRAKDYPSDVAEVSPFTPAYVRRLRYEAGIEPHPVGRRAKRKPAK